MTTIIDLDGFRPICPCYTKRLKPDLSLESALFCHYHNLIEQYEKIPTETETGRLFMRHLDWVLYMGENLTSTLTCPVCKDQIIRRFFVGINKTNASIQTFGICHTSCDEEECIKQAKLNVNRAGRTRGVNLVLNYPLLFSSLLYFSGRYVEQISPVFQQAFGIEPSINSIPPLVAFNALIKHGPPA